MKVYTDFARRNQYNLLSALLSSCLRSYCDIFAQGANCEASEKPLLHNDQWRSDDAIKQGAVAVPQPVNNGHY